jgi:hypothetical protein
MVTVLAECQSDCQGCLADGDIVADLIQSFQHQLTMLLRWRVVRCFERLLGSDGGKQPAALP